MNICVFCGSSTGNNPIFSQTAKELGSLIGQNNHTLIYGGGNIGLMGILADSVLAANGKVIGVIPDFLFQREVAHLGVSELIQVQTMHERKHRMADLADVFIAMPGGWGTLDELAEILTWRQLQIINEPIGILNSDEFFTPLIDMMNKMVAEGFLKSSNMQNLVQANSPKSLLTKLGVEL
jgi:uncharacterized protein (TIGR00730 family)